MRKIAGALGGIVLVVGAGCHSATTAPTSTSTSTTATSTSVSFISGVVMEGTRPLAGVSVDRGSGPGSWVVTDANGAFQLPANLGSEEWLQAGGKSGYVQPCATHITGNGPFTVQMVSRAALAGTPLSSPGGFRTVSGVVRQMTSDTLQGVEGAAVAFEPDLNNTDWDAAYTFTDSSGRFTLCGLPLDAVLIEAVGSTGSAHASAAVPSDQTYIELDLHP